jgi:hypothetical protein
MDLIYEDISKEDNLNNRKKIFPNFALQSVESFLLINKDQLKINMGSALEEIKNKIEADRSQVLDWLKILSDKCNCLEYKLENSMIKNDDFFNEINLLNQRQNESSEMIFKIDSKYGQLLKEQQIKIIAMQDKFYKLENVPSITRADTYQIVANKRNNSNANATFIFPNTNDFRLNYDHSFQKILKSELEWRGVMIDYEIPNKGKFSFKLKIESLNAMVGFGVKTENGKNGFYRQNCFMFDLTSGKLLKKGNEVGRLKLPKLKVGNIYKIELNMENKTSCLYINETIIDKPLNFDYKESELTLLCPCVDLYYPEEKVTLISLFSIEI